MITENEVLKVLKNHSIPNSDSLINELGLASTIGVMNYTPRDYQLTLITKILNEIIYNNKSTIVLNLPTGSGKSYIATALSILLDYYKISRVNPTSKTLSLTFRNNLFEQYISSFKYFFSIKGKSNYKCLLDYSPINSDTLCIKKSSKDCNMRFMCEYFLQRSNFYKSKSLITNYNWYIFNFYTLNIKEFQGTVILDEAHKLFDIIDELFTPDISKYHKLLSKVYESAYPKNKYDSSELKFLLDSGNYIAVTNILKELVEFLYTNPELNDYINQFENYRVEISMLEVIQEFGIPSELSRTDKVKMVVDILLEMNNPKKIKIFMSATISEDFFYNNFYDKDKSKVFYYSMDPIFPVENRLITTFKNLPIINYDRLQDKNFIDSWSNLIQAITEHHKDVKGFIFVNSYSQVRLLKQRFYNNPRMIFNDSSYNAKSSLEVFLNDKTNKIIISPVIIEGYDFKGDISRFQIIAKIPFLHHSTIKDYGEEFYYMKTVIELLQIYGRSIRSPEDYASTYILDNGYKMLDKYLPKWFKNSIIDK